MPSAEALASAQTAITVTVVSGSQCLFTHAVKECGAVRSRRHCGGLKSAVTLPLVRSTVLCTPLPSVSAPRCETSTLRREAESTAEATAAMRRFSPGVVTGLALPQRRIEAAHTRHTNHSETHRNGGNTRRRDGGTGGPVCVGDGQQPLHAAGVFGRLSSTPRGLPASRSTAHTQ